MRKRPLVFRDKTPPQVNEHAKLWQRIHYQSKLLKWRAERIAELQHKLEDIIR
jgi:hypothetical protein